MKSGVVQVLYAAITLYVLLVALSSTSTVEIQNMFMRSFQHLFPDLVTSIYFL